MDRLGEVEEKYLQAKKLINQHEGNVEGKEAKRYFKIGNHEKKEVQIVDQEEEEENMDFSKKDYEKVVGWVKNKQNATKYLKANLLLQHTHKNSFDGEHK